MAKCQIKNCEQEGTGYIEIRLPERWNGAILDKSVQVQRVRVCQEHSDGITQGTLTGFAIAPADNDSDEAGS